MEKVSEFAALQEFWTACVRRGVPAGQAKWLSIKVSDRELFLQLVQQVGKEEGIRYANLVRILIMYQSKEMPPEAIVDKISIEELKDDASSILGAIDEVRQKVSRFIVPAEEMAVSPKILAVKERQNLVTQIRVLRSDLDVLRGTARAVASATKSIVSSPRRTVFFPMPVMEVVDRQLARMWQRAGGNVSTYRRSKFTYFLENTYRVAGREIGSLSDRLAAARAETLRTIGANDIETELRKRQEIRWQRAFDLYFRQRTKTNPNRDVGKK